MRNKHQALSGTPPRRGMSLAWTVSLASTLIVGLIMGSLTYYQQVFGMKHERALRKDLISESLIPLQSAIRERLTFEDVCSVIQNYHDTYIAAGLPFHHLTLRDKAGAILFSTRSTLDDAERIEGSYLEADIVVNSPAIPGRSGIIHVEQMSNAPKLEHQRWRDWLIHMMVTISTIWVILFFAMRLLITQPLANLFKDIRRMERGYGNNIVVPSGAWELKWLSWRFNCLIKEHQRTTRALVLAEKRAASSVSEHTDVDPPTPFLLDSPSQKQNRQSSVTYAEAKLASYISDLQMSSPEEPDTLRLASEAQKFLSEKRSIILDSGLTLKLEQHIMSLLEPEKFTLVNSQRKQIHDLFLARKSEILRVLEKDMTGHEIPILAIDSRLKEAVSILRKMNKLDLPFDQITDLIGFRIIVPTERDCYGALGVCHELFKPILPRFKDYIESPKENGYQSLHTTVQTEDSVTFEFQIRSQAMHLQAEIGTADHRIYKSRDYFVLTAKQNGWKRYLRLLPEWVYRRSRSSQK